MIATPDELLDRARRRVGHSDFGPDGWQPGFEDLVAAVPTDVGEDPEAVARIEEIVVNRLVNRLRIEEWYATHGDEAAANEFEGHLIVIGTGTFGHDGGALPPGGGPAVPHAEEVGDRNPVPPPDLATEHDDPRRPRSVQASDKHIVTVDQHTEDRKIHELSFHDDGMTMGLRHTRSTGGMLITRPPSRTTSASCGCSNRIGRPIDGC